MPSVKQVSRTSTSRPTRKRDFSLPQDEGVLAQYRDEEPVNMHDEVDVPEWARGPFKLQIAHVFQHVPKQMIFSVLRQTGLGMIAKGDDAIEMEERVPRNGGHPYNQVTIHFDFLFTRGEDGERNINVLDHILHGGPDAHFQVVYQQARVNKYTGKEEPDRYWKVQSYRENRDTPSPARAPAIKISLGGGSLGPKDATTPVKTGPKSVQQLRREAAQRKAQQKQRTETDSDGFTQPKRRGAREPSPEPVKVQTTQSETTWSKLEVAESGDSDVSPTPAEAVSVETSSEKPMTKTARKNANKRARRKAAAEAAVAEQKLLDDAVQANKEQQQESKNQGTQTESEEEIVCDRDEPVILNTPEGLTTEEQATLDAAIAYDEMEREDRVTREEVAMEAARFLAENQMREDGLENDQVWQMDDATGSKNTIITPPTVADCEEIVAASEQVDINFTDQFETCDGPIDDGDDDVQPTRTPADVQM